MGYQLLAVDMDGTVLTSEKIISPRTRAAMEQAMRQGKEVLFATGRCPSEMVEYIQAFPEMKYAMCLSGALIFDVRSGKALSASVISLDLARQVLDLAQQLDAMVNIYAGPDVFVEKRRHGNLEYFNCQCFAELYDNCAVWVDDIREVLKLRGDEIYKINFYCHDDENWKKAAAILECLPLDYASGIPLNFEISPLGVNKGVAELRREVCAYMSRRFDLEYKPEEVLVTVGGSEAIDVAIRTLVNPGDEAIIPMPSFVCYEPIVRMAGGTPVIINTKAEHGFKLTPEELRSAITERTKLLVLPYPNNPTGAILEKEELEALAQVLRDTDVAILSDEIYAELTYGKRHISIASIEGMRERTIIASGFSKHQPRFRE